MIQFVKCLYSRKSEVLLVYTIRNRNRRKISTLLSLFLSDSLSGLQRVNLSLSGPKPRVRRTEVSGSRTGMETLGTGQELYVLVGQCNEKDV